MKPYLVIWLGFVIFVIGLAIGLTYAKSIISKCDVTIKSVNGKVVNVEIKMPSNTNMCITEVR